MVDALDRVRRHLRPDGYLIDIHPTEEPAHLEVRGPSGTIYLGDLKDHGDSGPCGRHAHADAALGLIVERGWFVLERRLEFAFHRHADTFAELREHIAAKWTNAEFDDVVLHRAEALANKGADIWLRQEAVIARLRPVSNDRHRRPVDPARQ